MFIFFAESWYIVISNELLLEALYTNGKQIVGLDANFKYTKYSSNAYIANNDEIGNVFRNGYLWLKQAQDIP